MTIEGQITPNHLNDSPEASKERPRRSFSLVVIGTNDDRRRVMGALDRLQAHGSVRRNIVVDMTPTEYDTPARFYGDHASGQRCLPVAVVVFPAMEVRQPGIHGGMASTFDIPVDTTTDTHGKTTLEHITGLCSEYSVPFARFERGDDTSPQAVESKVRSVLISTPESWSA